MNDLERKILNVINEMKRGFNPKLKCSVRKIMIARDSNINRNDLDIILSKNFK